MTTMLDARLLYDDRPPTDCEAEDPEVPGLVGWRGERLAARPIRKTRLWSMQAAAIVKRDRPTPKQDQEMTPREAAAVAIHLYDAAWSRIAAWKGGAA